MVGAEFRGGGGVWRAMQSFGLHVLLGRWFMAFASGSTYIFSVYSNDIKSTLGYDQTSLNQVSFFKDLEQQHWSPIWAYQRDHTPMGGPLNWGNHELVWLPHDMAQCHWPCCQTQAMANVFIYIYASVQTHKHLQILEFQSLPL